MFVSTLGRNLFPSVLLQPLGHLSVLRINDLRSRPREQNKNCVRPPIASRSLTGLLSIAAAADRGRVIGDMRARISRSLETGGSTAPAPLDLLSARATT